MAQILWTGASATVFSASASWNSGSGPVPTSNVDSISGVRGSVSANTYLNLDVASFTPVVNTTFSTPSITWGNGSYSNVVNIAGAGGTTFTSNAIGVPAGGISVAAIATNSTFNTNFRGTHWYCNLTGTGTLYKRGYSVSTSGGVSIAAGLGLRAPSFAGTIELQSGPLVALDNVTDAFGTGTVRVTASHGGSYIGGNGASGTSVSLGNRLEIRGYTYLGKVRESALTADNTSNLNFTGTVDFGSSNYTIECLSSVVGNSGTTTTFSGAVTGTAGFTKAGPSTLFITGAAPKALRGTITRTAGAINCNNSDHFLYATFTGSAVNNTTFTGGFARVGNLAGSENATLPHAYHFGLSDEDCTYSGNITSSFPFAKAGTGTWTLSGNNSGLTNYIHIIGGTLKPTSATAMGANVINSYTIIDGTGSTYWPTLSINKSAASVEFRSGGTFYANSSISYNCLVIPLNGEGRFNVDGAATLTMNVGQNAGASIFNLTTTGSLTKLGTGTAVINSELAPSYTGDTTCSGGTLSFNNAILSTSNVKMRGGALTNVKLSGSISLVADGAAGTASEVIQSASTSTSDASGGASVSAGNTLSLISETTADNKPTRTLGTMAVAVQGGGTLRTPVGTSQKARMRYGGNLTFNANSVMRFG